MATEFEILDVHHHVGNAFRALGGAVDSAPELSEAEFEGHCCIEPGRPVRNMRRTEILLTKSPEKA